MGCGPSVKKANDIPPANARPSNRNITSIGNFAEQPPSMSQIKPSNFDDIIKNDIRINDERKTPLILERMDFVNKRHKP